MIYRKSGSYLSSASVATLHCGACLSKIIPVVEDFLVTAAWLVLHVVQRTDLTLRLDVELLGLDLTRARVTTQILNLFKTIRIEFLKDSSIFFGDDGRLRILDDFFFLRRQGV